MSATKRRTSGAAGFTTGSALRASTGWPMRAILRIAMGRIWGRTRPRSKRQMAALGRGRHPKGLLVITAPLRKWPLGAAFADHRSRQQYRPGAEGAEKEDAA